MKRFKISISGSELLLNIDGEHRCCSLRAVRYLRASDAEQAGKIALIQVRQSGALQEGLCQIGGAPPRLTVESVTELGRLAFWRKRDDLEFCFDDIETGLSPAPCTVTEP